MGMREKEYEQRNKEDASGLSAGAPMEIHAFMLIHFQFSAITCCISISCIPGLSRVTQNIIFIQTRGSSVGGGFSTKIRNHKETQHLTQGQPFTDTRIRVNNYKLKIRIRTKHHFHLDVVPVPGSKCPGFPGWTENTWQATAGMINKKALVCKSKSL